MALESPQDRERDATRARHACLWIIAAMVSAAVHVGLRVALETWARAGDGPARASISAEQYGHYAAFIVLALLLVALVMVIRAHRGAARAVFIAAAVCVGAGLVLDGDIIYSRGIILRSFETASGELDAILALARWIETASWIRLGVYSTVFVLTATGFVVSAQRRRLRGPGGLAPASLVALIGLRAWLLWWSASEASHELGPEASALLYVGTLALEAALPLAMIAIVALYWIRRFPTPARIVPESRDWRATGERLHEHAVAIVAAKAFGFIALPAVVMASAETRVVVQLIALGLGAWVVTTTFRFASTFDEITNPAETGAKLLVGALVVEALGVALVLYVMNSRSLSLMLDLPVYLNVFKTASILLSIAGAVALSRAFEALAVAGHMPTLVRGCARLRIVLITAAVLAVPLIRDTSEWMGAFSSFYALAFGIVALAGMGLYFWTAAVLVSSVKASLPDLKQT